MIFTADRIHNGHHFLADGTAIEVAEDGAIIAVHEAFDGPSTHLEGILCPGLINAHCHLELSHLKDVVPQQTGLIPFLQSVMKTRFTFNEEQKKAARHEAFNELRANGVVAVGDIANTTDTLDLRALGRLHFHTFSECIGFTETAAEARLGAAREVYEAFAAQHGDAVVLQQSIAPHAPYSVSEKLFRLIDGALPGSVISIHNEESAEENAYYQNKSGAVIELLHGLGIDDSFFRPSGKTSLQTYLPWLGESHPLVLVHNTFSSREDVAFAESRSGAAFWCLCPAANLYIEGRLPEVDMLASLTDNICIGTDSLASNTRLDVLAELRMLHDGFPAIGWETLLRWATLNGAKALRLDAVLGSFEAGKRPGLVQITGLVGAVPKAVPVASGRLVR